MTTKMPGTLPVPHESQGTLPVPNHRARCLLLSTKWAGCWGPPRIQGTLLPVSFGSPLGSHVPPPTRISHPPSPSRVKMLPPNSAMHIVITSPVFLCADHSGTDPPSDTLAELPIFIPTARANTGLDLLAAAASGKPSATSQSIPPWIAGITPLNRAGPFNPAATLAPKVAKKVLELEFVDMSEVTMDTVQSAECLLLNSRTDDLRAAICPAS